MRGGGGPRRPAVAGTAPLEALAGKDLYWDVARRQMSLGLIFSGVGAVCAVALIAVTDPDLPGYRADIAWPFAFALLLLGLLHAVMAKRFQRPGLVVVTGVLMPINIALATALAGHYLSPTVALGTLLAAIITPILFPRRWGHLVLLVTCLGYGVAVLFDDGASAPLTRFVVISAQAGLIATIISKFSDTIFELSTAESAARTAAEEARAELQVVDQQKRSFLARMSHELRTPLNAIIGFSDLLRDQRAGPLSEKQREYVDDVASSGRHLLQLVDELLDVTEVETGRQSLDLAPVRLDLVLKDSVALFRDQAQRSGVRLELDVADDIGVVTADERKVKQILLNLVANALRFTPDGGSVWVVARTSGRSVVMSVTDTGPGIDRPDQERIFAEFEQAGHGREGTGLGLALSRRFAVMHGGRLTVTSRLGAGATFSLVLPRQGGAPLVSATHDDEQRPLHEQRDVGMWVRGGVLERLAGEQRLRVFMARIAGILALGEGVTLLLMAVLPEPHGFHGEWMLTVAVIALAVGAYMFLPGQSLSPRLAVAVGYFAIAAIAVLAWLAGPEMAPVMGSIFVLEGIVTFIGFRFRSAFPLALTIAVAYGGVLLIHWSGARSLVTWLLAMSLLASGGVLARWLVNFVPTLAQAEAEARREAEQANADLMAASRHKGEFLANMSHELRTPLNAILGFSEVLAEELLGPLNERQREYVDDVLVSGRHLLALINDILDLAKADAGRLDLDLDPVSLRAVVEAGAEPFMEEACRADVTLSVTVPPIDTVVHADAARLSKAIGCLVANAVAFTPVGGRIEVIGVADADTATVIVEDTGPGIDPGDHERIFTEFEQAATRLPEAGSGIGLTLARRLVDLHGGDLSVQSAVGKGSAFTIRVPIAGRRVEPQRSPAIMHS